MCDSSGSGGPPTGLIDDIAARGEASAHDLDAADPMAGWRDLPHQLAPVPTEPLTDPGANPMVLVTIAMRGG